MATGAEATKRQNAREINVSRDAAFERRHLWRGDMAVAV